MAKPLIPTPAGWYDDPYERGLQRYHNGGGGWTDQTRPAEPAARRAVAPQATAASTDAVAATVPAPRDRALPPSTAPLDVAVARRWRTYWMLYVGVNVGVMVIGAALLPVIGVQAFAIVLYALSLLILVTLLRLAFALLRRHDAKFRR